MKAKRLNRLLSDEAMEELGVEVAIKRTVAIIHFDQSTQYYFLADRVGGKFGSGTGEEFTDSDPDDPEEGIYSPHVDADRGSSKI